MWPAVLNESDSPALKRDRSSLHKKNKFTRSKTHITGFQSNRMPLEGFVLSPLATSVTVIVFTRRTHNETIMKINLIIAMAAFPLTCDQILLTLVYIFPLALHKIK